MCTMQIRIGKEENLGAGIWSTKSTFNLFLLLHQAVTNYILVFKQCGVSIQTITIVLVLIDKKCIYIFIFYFFYSFGKRIGGAARRHNECLILEPSEMIVVSNKNILFSYLFFSFSPIFFFLKAQLPTLVLSPYDFNLFLGLCPVHLIFEVF